MYPTRRHVVAFIAAILAAAFVYGQEAHHGLLQANTTPLMGPVPPERPAPKDHPFRVAPSRPAPRTAVQTADPEGATDPRVTQATIEQTICAPGWSEDVRPPESYTEPIKRQLVAARGGSLSDYELDHIIPLELGGAPASTANLQLQLWPDARAKDHYENAYHAAVCSGSMSLADARERMATWGR